MTNRPGEMTEEERMAAEWASMSDSADLTFGDTNSARVLNQDEIDSLLGFERGGGAEVDNTGIMAVVNSALINYERLPMLDVLVDRLVRLMSTSLRNFTSDNVEVSVDQQVNVRFGEYLNSIPLPAMLAVFKAEEWDNYGLLTIDSAMIYSIIDVLLGGRRGTSNIRIEGRPYTTIERSLVERLIQLFLSDLSAAFDPLSPVTFRLERLETNPRFASITNLQNVAILVKLRIDMEDRGGKLELMLPYATLEPVRELLLQMYMGEKFGRDAIWESHLAGQLWRTDVDIMAVLDQLSLSLYDVLNWKVGTQLLLNATPDGLVELRCGETPMFVGKMGRKNGNIAVRIERDVHRERENGNEA